MSQYYLSNDLFVGACVNFNSHIFVLIDADEYAFRYMEQNPGVSVEYFWIEFTFKKKHFSVKLSAAILKTDKFKWIFMVF